MPVNKPRTTQCPPQPQHEAQVNPCERGRHRHVAEGKRQTMVRFFPDCYKIARWLKAKDTVDPSGFFLCLTFLFWRSSSCSMFSSMSFFCETSLAMRWFSVWRASTLLSWAELRPDFQPSSAMKAMMAADGRADYFCKRNDNDGLG